METASLDLDESVSGQDAPAVGSVGGQELGTGSGDVDRAMPASEDGQSSQSSEHNDDQSDGEVGFGELPKLCGFDAEQPGMSEFVGTPELPLFWVSARPHLC